MQLYNKPLLPFLGILFNNKTGFNRVNYVRNNKPYD